MYQRLAENGLRFASSNSAIGHLSRFMTAGVLATVVYFLTSNLIILSNRLAPERASVAAYLLAMIFSFFAQGRFTFRVSKTTWGQFLRFVRVSGIGLAMSYWAVQVAAETARSPFWATLAVSVVMPIISFVAMRFWIFADSR
jgi:putative flippase GtrA